LWPITQNGRIFIAAILLAIWGLRLSLYLGLTRLRWHTSDRRYEVIGDKWFAHFQMQALMAWVISLVFFFASMALLNSITWIDIVAYGVIIVGIIGETVSDLQLLNFKKKFPEKVCDLGLWHVSRHPNTFFDWVTWCGFFMIGSQSPYGWLSIVSPLCLYIILNYVTNPITEKCAVNSKGDAYRHYQSNTPPFFPGWR
jgi:steroid 5-alpha reductase family enzyme